MMITTTTTEHQCKRRTVMGENHWEGERGKKSALGCEEPELYYICIYEEHVMKPTKCSL
jgi:hypothetical protein